MARVPTERPGGNHTGSTRLRRRQHSERKRAVRAMFSSQAVCARPHARLGKCGPAWPDRSWSAVSSVACAAVARRDSSSSTTVTRHRPACCHDESARSTHTPANVHDSETQTTCTGAQSHALDGCASAMRCSRAAIAAKLRTMPAQLTGRSRSETPSRMHVHSGRRLRSCAARASPVSSGWVLLRISCAECSVGALAPRHGSGLSVHAATRTPRRSPSHARPMGDVDTAQATCATFTDIPVESWPLLSPTGRHKSQITHTFTQTPGPNARGTRTAGGAFHRNETCQRAARPTATVDNIRYERPALPGTGRPVHCSWATAQQGSQSTSPSPCAHRLPSEAAPAVARGHKRELHVMWRYFDPSPRRHAASRSRVSSTLTFRIPPLFLLDLQPTLFGSSTQAPVAPVLAAGAR